MKRWKRTSLLPVIVGLAAATMLSFVAMHAAEKTEAGENQHAQRLFKFKTSDPNGMNIATQMTFQPGQKSKLKLSVQSGNKTNSIEFAVRSVMDGDAPFHIIEAHFIEQHGWSKPEILRHPNLRTIESYPAVLEIDDFHFEVLIEPVK